MNPYSRKKWETELSEELRDHFERQLAANIAAGMSPQEARREATLQFGASEGVKEDCREQRRGFWLEALWVDTRYALRTLRKNPGFAAIAILTLALGIGANTAIFSVVNAVLLRPLPFAQPERLVQLWETETAVPLAPLAAPDYVDWRAQNQTFDDMTLFSWPQSFNMSGAGEPERILGIYTQSNFFSVLGATPLRGRTFADGEDQAGHNHVVMFSYGLWQRRFGGAPDTLQKEIEINGEKFQVVGIMPADFNFPARGELWAPIDMDPKKLSARGNHNYRSVGRLKPSVTPQQAQENLQAIAERLSQQFPDSNRHIGASVISLREQLVGKIRPALLVLLGAVALVLLIACVNVANLLLARASTRHREMALRSALGAAPSRIVRQLLTESVLLSSLAAIPGLLLAASGEAVLRSLPGVPVPDPGQVHLDTSVLFFAVGIAVLTGLLFGLAPAIHAGRQNLHEELKSGGKGAGTGASSNRWLRDALVVGEVALSLALLIGAGLLLRSFARLRAVDIGVRSENVLTARVSLPETRYATPGEKSRALGEITARLEHAPGVDAAAMATEIPLDGGTNTYAQKIGATPEEQGSLMEWNEVTPGYFHALGIPFHAGRNFTPADSQRMEEVKAASKDSPASYSGPPMIAIINQMMATDFWPNQDAVGKTFLMDHSLLVQVTGVVGDTKIFSAVQQKTIDEAYFPMGYSIVAVRDATIIVHSPAAPASLSGAMRQAIAHVDTSLPIYNIRTMDQIIAEASSDTRFQALLLGIFAGLALLLAAVGIYGVMSYHVAQRTNEIGIRMALGAHPPDILRLVIGRGFVLTLAGLALGIAVAFALSRSLESLLFGVSASDPVTFGAVAALLGIVALAACYLPARRAANISPLVALRYQ
ncbi:MAG: ADOP family duplicated permease [Candidatus Acidiferrales bacterium]